jgi:hypothetical protein
MTSPAARQRHLMALGADRANQLEAYLRVESLGDRLRQALGNSTTARQLHEMGLAGRGLGLLASEHLGGEHGGIFGMMLGLGRDFAKHKMSVTQQSIATEIGRLLATEDPATFVRGVQAASRTPFIMDALRRAGDRLDTMLGRAAQSQLQQPAVQTVQGLGQ